jgi:AraC-like DNA-binding protein/ubiquinone/menaquinone biosynthesis C-methylase UbiE
MESIKRLNDALAYVEETLESQIDDVEFSRIAACPFAVFQRFFMLITGTTLNEYVRLRRFSRAADEILNSRIKIIDIALKYGYESSDAFCVAFKRIYGMTPTAARKNNAVLPPYDRITFTLSITYIKEEKRMSQSGNQLESVAKSYDKTIDFGRRGIDLYTELPDYITNDPDYPAYKTELEGGFGGSECIDIKNYLVPNTDMNFVDLGCSLNLMFKGYDKWLSTYHGVDISEKTIELLNEFVTKNKMQIGSLYCGSIHETPFEDNYFDIGACIGVLEYFEKDFVKKAIIEAHRIIKPNGKLVLDIPSIESPTGRVMMKIEEFMGRPDKFNMLPQEFEDMIRNYFEIEETNRAAIEGKFMGIMYCLRCKK